MTSRPRTGGPVSWFFRVRIRAFLFCNHDKRCYNRKIHRLDSSSLGAYSRDTDHCLTVYSASLRELRRHYYSNQIQLVALCRRDTYLPTLPYLIPFFKSPVLPASCIYDNDLATSFITKDNSTVDVSTSLIDEDCDFSTVVPCLVIVIRIGIDILSSVLLFNCDEIVIDIR